MIHTSLTTDTLAAFLDSSLDKHHVVGCSVALQIDEKILTATRGVANRNSGQPVTENTCFQVGSISKLFTAVLVMQMVDEKIVDLDIPVVEYLPDFETLDRKHSRSITLRHLLSHISGIEGDFFPADDLFNSSVENYVRKMRLLPSLHPLGAYMTYCNSGYVVAGRVAEVMRRQPWHRLVEERILKPLKLTDAFADTLNAIRHATAVGHSQKSDSDMSVSSRPYLPLGMAPAGSILSMSAKALLAFALDLHSIARNGESKLLSEKAVQSMLSPQVAMPPYSRPGFDHMGIGWFIGEIGGAPSFGHDGSTGGQQSYLLCVPQRGFYLALLTNSPSQAFAREFKSRLLAELFDAVITDPAPGVSNSLDHRQYTGVYENIAARLVVYEQKGELWFQTTSLREDVEMTYSARLSGGTNDEFNIVGDGDSPIGTLLFLDSKNGRCQYVRQGLRMARRVSDFIVAGENNA